MTDKTTYLTAAAWNKMAAPIKSWNHNHGPAEQKRLPPIDRVRARGWMLTINAEKHDRADVDAILGSIPTAAVYSLESGSTTGYRHYQTFAYWESKIAGSRVRALFGDAHCEPAGKPAVACAAYCSKTATHVGGPWWLGACNRVPGMRPTNEQRARHDRFDDLTKRIDSGTTYFDLVNDPEWCRWALAHSRAIHDLIAARISDRFGNAERAVSCDYIWGEPGSGKTSSILRLYGYRDVFIVNTASTFPFDGYAGEPVILLDDFRTSLPYGELLRVLDRYPLPLNVKNGKTFAAWRKVVISSNVPLTDQYPNINEKRGSLYRRFAGGIVFEKPDPDTPLPYDSIDDAMVGKRNDGLPNGMPGYEPDWGKSDGDGSVFPNNPNIDSVFNA